MAEGLQQNEPPHAPADNGEVAHDKACRNAFPTRTAHVIPQRLWILNRTHRQGHQQHPDAQHQDVLYNLTELAFHGAMRLVAVSGNTTVGLNVLAASISMLP